MFHKNKPYLIFNPIKKQLLTEDGKLLKKLNCPFSINWEDLKKTKPQENRECHLCSKQIVNSSSVTTEELMTKIKLNPDICLKVDLEQNNIRVENDHA